MKTSTRLLGACLFLFCQDSLAQVTDADQFFESRVRPVLVNNCHACHTTTQMGGLRVDARDHLLKGGKAGPAIVPGKPEESLLIRAVSQTDPLLKMPMGGQLEKHEIDDLIQWVKMGAPWPNSSPIQSISEANQLSQQKDFWSFRPIRTPPLPTVKSAGWIRSPIDRFILAKLEAQGLEPVRPADKGTLLRRATLDLIGLPPTPKELEDFLRDDSPSAFKAVVDRLLASPHYGERWARYWLDVARYGEDDVRSDINVPYPNAWRYRDWVIQALNEDMPYDLFVKAQIAGDLLDQSASGQVYRLTGGTGFFGLGPWYYDIAQPAQARADERNDRVDALTRGFLGLTVACARCHDHKYDPLSATDYYALAGVFASSEYQEYALAPDGEVSEFKKRQKKVNEQEKVLKKFIEDQTNLLAESLARQTSRYVLGAWRVLGPARPSLAEVVDGENLDNEVLESWIRYLSVPQKEHPFMDDWKRLLAHRGSIDEARRVAGNLQQTVLALVAEKKEVDEANRPRLEQLQKYKDKGDRLLPNAFVTLEDYCPQCAISLKTIAREKFVLWTDLFAGTTDKNDPTHSSEGVLRLTGEKLQRFLSSEQKDQIAASTQELENAKKALPAPYPYLHGIGEASLPRNLRMHLRGSPYNLGEEVPRGFIQVLSEIERLRFTKGSGRVELAEVVANHPLAARVMVNRVWKHHFGRGIVNTPSNFGQLGDRPSHPELLEYLAHQFRQAGYSLKTLHREIMLTASYQLSSDFSSKNHAIDPDNRLHWRANRRGLDAEALRDSFLFVSGSLDLTVGGPSIDLNDGLNARRTVYAKIGRFKLNSLLTLFDFPDPSISSEQRNVTNVPLQGLFFMNSPLVYMQANQLVKRLSAEDSSSDSLRIRRAYRLLFGRDATEAEVTVGEKFLRGNEASRSGGVSAWQLYAQVLLSSNEFLFVN